MTSFLKDKKGIGAVVCRMQVPKLTDSHKKMLRSVCARHQRVVIFLGTTNKKIDKSDPFPFEFRKKMIEDTAFDAGTLVVTEITILPLPDIKNNNKRWVKNLDIMLQAFLNHDEQAILYGGRDSFIPAYISGAGKFQTSELAAEDYDSGTQLRALAAVKLPAYSEEVGNAILWTLNQIL